MEELFNEILKEASIGNIIIDGDNFPIAFNSLVYENNKEIENNSINDDFPTLIIKNKQLFFSKLFEYINIALLKIKKFPTFVHDIDKNRIKLLITYIFANATTEDFLNPVGLLDRNIAFLNDNSFENLNDGMIVQLLNCFDNSSLEIKRTEQSIFTETSNRMDFSLTKYVDGEMVRYILPSITYGISINEVGEKECYIYTILHPKTKLKDTEMQQKYSKKISRELYKLNNGVFDRESNEYKEYCQGDRDYYPENISDVSPSSLVSLIAFVGLLEKENITNVKAVPYLPIRFLSRDLSAKNQQDYEKGTEIYERNIQLQKNITDKFIRTFRREQYHFNGLKINSFPYEIDEYMNIDLDFMNQDINNSMLNDVYKSTLNALTKNARKKRT